MAVPISLPLSCVRRRLASVRKRAANLTAMTLRNAMAMTMSVSAQS